MKYYCTKCKHNHVRGKIYEDHKKYAENEGDSTPGNTSHVVKKPEPPKKIKNVDDIKRDTEWIPRFKSGKMSRYNESGEYVERYMTKKEELKYARSIAIARDERWNRLKEWVANRKLKKIENESGND